MTCASRSRFIVACYALVALCGGGCTIPKSEYPLSDEKTSVIDERMIGHWDFEAEPAQQIDPMRFVVGRDPKAANLLEYVAATLNSEQKIEIHRGPLLITKIGNAHYLSFGSGDSKEGYLIMRYDIKVQPAAATDAAGPNKPSHDTGELHLMIDTVIADAIEKGELAGKVTRDKSSRRPQEIRITAKPDELRAYIEKHADQCFTPDSLKMRRLNLP